MITRRCHDCGAELEAGTLEDFADVFLSHVRSTHSEWPFPDAAVRMVGENVARLTGNTERLEEVGPITVEPVIEDRLDDWAAFFDHDSHAGNPVGGACYCTEAHVIEAGKPPPPHPGWRAHRELMLDLLRTGRAFGYLDTNNPNLRAISHFETELARIAGVHDTKKLKADPAFALGNLFGRLPLSRTPLLKTLASEAKGRNL